MQTGEDISKEYGIPIVNKRISVTPIALIGGSACKKSEDFVTIVHFAYIFYCFFYCFSCFLLIGIFCRKNVFIVFCLKTSFLFTNNPVLFY